ncbi:MAG TPA: hypothetical protein VJA47_04865 [archaeon]|nr:hypothetical protein [archaeon]
MEIIALTSDIMFIPLIQSALSKHHVQLIESYNGEDAGLFVLDMDHKDSFEVCRKFPEKSICFGSHKNTEQIKKFRELGCKGVVARSMLKKTLEEIKT